MIKYCACFWRNITWIINQYIAICINKGVFKWNITKSVPSNVFNCNCVIYRVPSISAALSIVIVNNRCFCYFNSWKWYYCRVVLKVSIIITIHISCISIWSILNVISCCALICRRICFSQNCIFNKSSTISYCILLNYITSRIICRLTRV